MALFVKSLTSKANGLYAVKLGDYFQVFTSKEVTLGRLKEIFPGLPLYECKNKVWTRIKD